MGVGAVGRAWVPGEAGMGWLGEGELGEGWFFMVEYVLGNVPSTDRELLRGRGRMLLRQEHGGPPTLASPRIRSELNS